jgi:hypothetical protein
MVKNLKWTFILCILFCNCGTVYKVASEENAVDKIQPKSIFIVYDFSQSASNDVLLKKAVSYSLKESNILFDSYFITPLTFTNVDDIRLKNAISKFNPDLILRIKPLDISIKYYRGGHRVTLINYLFDFQSSNNEKTYKKFIISLDNFNSTKIEEKKFNLILKNEIFSSL